LLLIVARGRLAQTWTNLRDMLYPILLRAAGLPAEPAAPRASVGSLPYAVAIALGTVAVVWTHHH
jgi:prepilin peptidase CpaA